MGFRDDELLHGNCPRNIYAQKTAGTGQVRRPSFESRRVNGKESAIYKTPTGDSDINFRLHDTVGDSDEIQEIAQIISIQHMSKSQQGKITGLSLTKSRCFRTTA